MTYKICIRKNSTGEERIATNETDWYFEDGEGQEYLWTDGNNGCDCNRELYYERALGVEPAEVKCGDERFSVLWVELPDGKRIPIDHAS